MDDNIYNALIVRLQDEAIIAANLEDLVTCPQCYAKRCVDRDVNFYDCSCGRRQCRNCPRLYDERHERHTCSELDELDIDNGIHHNYQK